MADQIFFLQLKAFERSRQPVNIQHYIARVREFVDGVETPLKNTGNLEELLRRMPGLNDDPQDRAATLTSYAKFVTG